jgi:ATP-dependent helicase/nuclease subunit A
VRLRAKEEYRRLLYVAMTRARDRLYVCGTLKERGTDAVGGWHGLISDALRDEWQVIETPEGEAYEWRAEPRRDVRLVTEQTTLPLHPATPDWLATSASPPPPLRRRLVPSAVEDDSPAYPVLMRKRSYLERRADPESAAALDRGRLIHRLLQSLPEFSMEAREAAARGYLAVAAVRMPEAERSALVAEVLAVMADERFAPVFAKGSRAEVDVAGLIPAGAEMAAISGRIDRLAVTAERVLIVDYKTNRPAPSGLADVPPAYVAQLALYREVLRRAFAKIPVATAILWTDLPSLMEIPSTSLDAALLKVASSAGNRLPSIA